MVSLFSQHSQLFPRYSSHASCASLVSHAGCFSCNPHQHTHTNTHIWPARLPGHLVNKKTHLTHWNTDAQSHTPSCNWWQSSNHNKDRVEENKHTHSLNGRETEGSNSGEEGEKQEEAGRRRGKTKRGLKLQESTGWAHSLPHRYTHTHTHNCTWLTLGRWVWMCVYSSRSVQGVSLLLSLGTCFLRYRYRRFITSALQLVCFLTEFFFF